VIATYYASVATSNEDAGAATVRPDHVIVRDPAVMRVLSHPARLAILEYLVANGGDITATEAAEIVGLSPSATSYHLRALAKINMIGEAPSRGDARERVYSVTGPRRVEVTTDLKSPDPAANQAAEELLDAVLARADERLRRWRAGMHQEPQEWFDASIINESFIRVTPEELLEIFERLVEVLNPYRQSAREEPPEGARLVSVQLRGIPVI
jgi:DNA-binding transcriptional ArsR family regulator